MTPRRHSSTSGELVRTLIPSATSCAQQIWGRGIQKFRDEFDAYIAGARRPLLAAV